ncbi:MAG TPA: hypothetical protein EYQ31_14170 [Candidatus Handelsmanbacteria bacterium]|nr:hypothetical protein [Candidatus Handelsmanbacteria bacterium]
MSFGSPVGAYRSEAALMVLGTHSNAGKNIIATRLCRLLSRRGYRVAPFNAQNMSNNAGVTAAGGEMGRALIDALASGTQVVGICGDLQMLGTAIRDPEGVEAPVGSSSSGLGLTAGGDRLLCRQADLPGCSAEGLHADRGVRDSRRGDHA